MTMAPEVRAMSDSSEPSEDAVRWTGRLAAAGLGIAAVVGTVAALGISLPGSVYWLGIVVALGGILGATVVIFRASSAKDALGVIAAVFGVLLCGYGVENGVLVATVVGVLFLVVGAIGVVVDTRPEKD
jgi:uncharacterized membrane protein HdeD (DUF308 family)